MSKKQCAWNGIAYNSIAEAAEANDMNYIKMQQRIKAGHTCDEDVRPLSEGVWYEGVWYPSLRAAADEAGISHEGLRKRLKKAAQHEAQ